MKQKIYRAPKGKPIESFLISMFDGTGSMNYEYEQAVGAHNKVFGYKGNMKEEYQFTEQLHESFLPFQCSGSGNITNAFNKILNKLLANQEKYKNYITIIFLSDGEEQFELEKLKNLIEEVKTKFHIKFISVPVGQYFPRDISNDLRDQLHTEDDAIFSMKSVKRDPNLSEAEVYELFFKVFTEIKDELKFQEGTITVNQPVKQHLLGEETTKVLADQTFQTINANTEVEANGQVIEETKDIKDVEGFIEKSVHKVFIQGTNETYKEQFEKIEEGISEIVKHYPQVEQIKEQGQVQPKITQVLALVHSIVEGDLCLDQLTDSQKTRMQEGLFSEEVNLITEIVKCSDHVKVENLTEKLVNDRVKEKYKQIKAGCYVKGKQVKQLTQQNQIQLNKLQQVSNLVGQTLQETIQLIQKNNQIDPIEILKQFKDTSFDSMRSVFKQVDFKIEEESEIMRLKQLNFIFEQIHKVTQKQLSLAEFLNLEFDCQDKLEGNIVQSAFFQVNQDFEYLPHELNILYQEGNLLEEAEKVFVLLVDQSPSMINEENVAIQAFLDVFKNVPTEKKIVLTFKDKQIFLHNISQKQNQVQSFQSLLTCFKSLEEQYELKQRRINICLVSDGKGEDYKVVHKQFKVTRFYFSFSLIYFTIGGLLKAQIEGNLKNKYQNRDVKGCPKLVNIPRKLQQSTNQNNDLNKQFIQRFEEILKDFIGAKNEIKKKQ